MKASSNRPPVRVRKNPHLGLVIFIDILLVGVGLVVFALFHHVLPRDIRSSGQALPQPTVTTTVPVYTENTTETSMFVETTPRQIQTEMPSETTKIVFSGMWGKKFADKFSNDIIIADDSYQSATMNISIDQVQENEVTYYIADIYLSDIQHFRTAFAGGSYARNRADYVQEMASENNAILAISGDYYGIRDSGIVIRNGELYRENLFNDVLLMNNDGSLETFAREEFDIEQVKTDGAWQAWSFGPMLLDGGQPMTSFTSDVTRLNPRSAIGYYEPGHYCFVLVDGRQPDYSIGMTMEQLSQLFFDLGCKAAYNLDGGQSAAMIFNGELVNQPYNDGRRVSDIIYIGE